MPVLLATHAELYVDELSRDTPHNDKGFAKIRMMAQSLIDYINNDIQGGGLNMLLLAEGTRYKDVFKEIRYLSKFEVPCYKPSNPPPEMITGVSWFLGGSSSRKSKQKNMVFCDDLTFHRSHCRLLSDCVSVEQAWEYVKREDEECEGYKVFCSGRQQLKSLGHEKKFKIASVFHLDWRNPKKLECIIKNGKPVKKVTSQDLTKHC